MAVTARQYSAKSDVYSFGVYVWEVFSDGAAPFAGIPMSTLTRSLLAGERLRRPSAQTPPFIMDCILKCTSLPPSARPTMATVLHWLREQDCASAAPTTTPAPAPLLYSSNPVVNLKGDGSGALDEPDDEETSL